MLFDLLILLLFLYIIFGGISRAAARMRLEQEKAEARGGRAPVEKASHGAERLRTLAAGSGERSQISFAERLARMQRQAPASRRLPTPPADPQRGPLGRLSKTRLESDEGSLEQYQVDVVDQDEDAEAVVRQRRQAAEREWMGTEGTRKPVKPPSRPEPQPSGNSRATARLRTALVWREILGPPVSMRDPSWPG